MARKIINIGAIGNDGTGDSIRDSFRSVNDNFRELYSSLGLGEKLTFIGLDDVPDSYFGQEDAIVTVNNTTDGLSFRKLEAGTGIQIEFNDSNSTIVVNSLFSDISGDPAPNLGGPVAADTGGSRYPIGNMPDIGNYTEITDAVFKMSTIHGVAKADPNRLVANKGYVDSKISLAGVDAVDPATNQTNTAFGTMTGPLILSRDPVDDDDQTYNGLIAASKRYVDNSGYSSTVNLYVSTSGADDRKGVGVERQGRSSAYAYRTLEGALKRAEELILEAPPEIGPYKKVLTYGNGSGSCTLTGIDDVSATTGSGFVPQNIYMNVESVSIASGGFNYLPGDILTVVGGTGTAARYEVLAVGAGGSGGRGPVTSIRQLTTGSYTDLPTATVSGTATSTPGSSAGVRTGCFLNITYKVSRVTISNGGTDYGLVSVRFIGGGGTGAFGRADVSQIISPGVGGTIQSITITDGGSGFTSLPNLIVSLPRFKVFTNGLRTDFTGNPSLTTAAANAAKDVREGLYLRGETSGALAQILAHSGTLDGLDELFDVDIVSGTFIENEVLSYGDVAKNIQISVFVESGIYLENYPLRVPENVAIIGDEFRRTIIRPNIGVDSSSPWAFIHFRRDPVIDGLEVTSELYGYHYLADPSQPVYPLIDNKGGYRSAAELLRLNRVFIQYQIVGWINNQIAAGVGDWNNFSYDQDFCFRDVGLIIDSMIFDLKYSGYARTVSAALKYKNVTEVVGNPFTSLGAQENQTVLAIQRIDTLAQQVINNSTISVLYTEAGSIATTSTIPSPQILDEGIVKETGSDTVITTLINVVVDIITNSGAVNYPKDNQDMDVFLCNDAVILRAMTYQGHGGFALVLDPEGQVLAKSPYCQEAASFSRSTGRKRFGGGMFVDGFTGNQQFVIDSKDSDTVLRVSGLLRIPNVPCSFIVNDTIYRINYVRGYTYGIGLPTPTTGGYSTAQFILDELTPFPDNAGSTNCTFNLSSPTTITATTGSHGLQVGATVKFTSTGTLPAGIELNKPYYVLLAGFTLTSFRVTDVSGSTTPIEYSTVGTGTHSFIRVYEVLMPGNRSMLSNDFTQVCDLGYGLVVTNGGLTEAVSMFTYYCQISYYALNGGQIRSIGGSSSHGNFALVAEGSDPLEVPTPAGFYTQLAQTATIFAATTSTVNERGDIQIYINYDDFLPLPGSELEINHGNNIVRYAISTSTIDDAATRRAKLNISTGGGLIAGVPHGQPITIRNNAFHVLTGDVVNVATRPSTALILQDSPFVYRVLEFDEYDSRYDYDTYTLTNINLGTGVITTDIPHRQRDGYKIQFQIQPGATLPNEIVAGEELVDSIVYYVTNATEYTFKISTTATGAGISTFTGSSLSGTVEMVPYGLALTQLRENYDYIELTVYEPATTTGATKSVSSIASNTITSAGHGLSIGSPIRFAATSYPGGTDGSKLYFITTKNYGTNTFSISERAIVDSTLIGVTTSLAVAPGPNIGTITGAGPFFATISNLTCIDTLEVGMRIERRANITGVTAAGDGTTATLTFSAQNIPPYLPYQQILVSGFGGGAAGYNGTQTVISCTNTTVTFTNATSTAGTAGTISVVETGALAADTTIYSISRSANTIVITSALTMTAGTVVFQAEGELVSITSSGTAVTFKRALGERDDTTVAVSTVGGADQLRIENGISAGNYYKFVYEGTEYEITNYQSSTSLGTDYSLLTVNPPLVRSVVRYNDPITLKAAVPGSTDLADGTLTIRISLTRVTSHDLLEIGTGGYADTNYPNEIYGPPVNSITSVPTYATQADTETGELVLRAQMQERGSGRTFFVTTDQFGNFNVGPFFRVDQGTGTVTFSASIALSQLDGLGFKRGTTISEFSTAMDEGRVDAVPTEAAVRTYIGRRLGLDYQGNVVAAGDRVPANVGFMALNGDLPWVGPGDMDMSNYKITNLADPILDSDAARLDSINITNLKDTDGSALFDLTQVQAGQLLALTGDHNTIQNFTPTGEVTFDILAGDSTTSVIRTIISDGVIDNANINSSAAIDQSKLNLNAATTRSSAVGIAQADRGVASFDSVQFTATNGWLTVKDNGLTLSKLSQISNNTVLGYASASTSTSNVTSVTFAKVVEDGLALRLSDYGGATQTGYLRHTGGDGTNRSLWNYSIVDEATASTPSTLVKRDSNGDFAANVVTLSQLKIDSIITIDTNSSGTASFMQYYGGGGQVGIYLGDGASGDKVSYYNNNSHVLRSQDSASTFATINTNGITVGAVRNVTVITTGAAATVGNITGDWRLTAGSKLQATYAADLAEYYEGDKEYPVGTVLIFGGDKEVTVSTSSRDHRVAGVVSDNAAYSMNGACPGLKNQIALQGRVPCRVVGKIKKGDLLVTGNIAGCAVSAGGEAKTGTVIGKALEDYDSDHIGTIEVAVGRN